MAAKAGNTSERTLVMLSGGIDSTATLWHILNNADKYGEILVHHIHIHNVEGRWKVEAEAVKAILEYLRAHAPTPFTASDSVIAVPSVGKSFLYDTEVVSFISGYMTSRDPSITKVIIGGTGSDFASPSVSRAVVRGKAIHNAFHGDSEDHSGAIKEYPLQNLMKQEVYDTLPPELAKLTWSCRTPRTVAGRYIECGKCKTCRLELRSLVRTTQSTKGTA